MSNLTQGGEALKADMLRALPGGTMDDSTFEAIEEALDRADAPSVKAGKWLTLVERIAALTHKSTEEDRLRGALTKINAIRNSIIGMQGFNFSEHAYPLVAALNEAGFEGLAYPEARANLGTLIEQIKAAEEALATLRATVVEECAKVAWSFVYAGDHRDGTAVVITEAIRRLALSPEGEEGLDG